MAQRFTSRRKKTQMLATVVLASSTIAPYVASAEEANEKTIDNQSAINSSGGNTDTGLDSDGFKQFSTLSDNAATNASSKEDISYTMQADPNGPMADFITNYLAPYFTNAQLVKIDGEQFVEFTLVEKAYGFQTLQYLDHEDKKHDVQLVSSTGEKMEQVRVIRMPLIQNEEGISKVFIDSGELGYGAYTLFFTFDLTNLNESTPDTEETPEPEQQTDLNVVENAWYFAAHSNPSARTEINAIMQSADFVTREDGQYVRLTVKETSSAFVVESDAYKLISSAEDGTKVIEAKLDDSLQATIPFMYSFMNGMLKYDNDVTIAFPHTTPIDGTIVEENRPFVITAMTKPYYAKPYTNATKNATLIEKDDGHYARITIEESSHISPNVTGANLVGVTEQHRVYEVKLNESLEGTVTFVSASKQENAVTYNFKDNIENESLPVLYKGVGSYLDISEKTNTIVHYEADADAETAKLVNESFNVSPYVAPAQGGIYLGLDFNLPENVTSIALKDGRSTLQTWTNGEDNAALHTLYQTALSDQFSFEVTYADATVKTLAIDYFELAQNAAEIVFEEENVQFQFTTGADFETGAPTDSYLRDFVTKADFVYDAAGNPYAEITFGGHSYAATAFKVNGEEAKIIEQSGSAEAKDLVRTVRVPLDEQYRANVEFESTRGNYTFKFDFIEEKTNFNFTTGTAQDAYFSAWINSAHLVTTAAGQKYAYITLGGHSYAINAITIGDAPATIIQSTGSAETKDLQRTVRVALDENNQAAITLDGGARGNYTFTFDFTKQQHVPIEELLKATHQAVNFKYSSAVSWHAMAFPATITTASAAKVDDEYEVTVQLNTDGLTGFTVTQNDAALATWDEKSQLVTFKTASLQGIQFKADKTADRGSSSFEVAVDDISLNSEGTLPTDWEAEATIPDTTTGYTPLPLVHSMKADPNGDMAEFITNYLNPYFEKAQLVEIDGEKYVDFTLTGKAYGFSKIQYYAENGKTYDAKVISSTGEKLEQVRVVRIPYEQGVTKLFVDSGELGYGAYTLLFDFAVKAAANVLAADKPVTIQFDVNVADNEVVRSAISKAKVQKSGQKFKLSFNFEANDNVKKFVIFYKGKEIGKWTPNNAARAASLFNASIVSASNDELTVEVDDFNELSFEVYDSATENATPIKADVTAAVIQVEDATIQADAAEGDNNAVVPSIPDEEAGSTNNNSTSPSTPNTGNNSNNNSSTSPSAPNTGGGSTNHISDTSTITSSVSIKSSFSSEMLQPGIYGAADGSFISNYLAPYIGNAKLVTIGGKKYIDITLSGKAYAVTSFSGGTVVSSQGSDLNQVRVVRIPAAKTSTHAINAGDYGSYNLTFTFDVIDSQLAESPTTNGNTDTPTANGNTDAPATNNTDTPTTNDNTNTQPEIKEIPSTGDATFELVLMSGNEKMPEHISNMSTVFENNTFKVNMQLNTANGLNQFIVKQNGKEIASWKKKGVASLFGSLFNRLMANTTILSFEVEDLNGLSFEAVTATDKLEAAVTGTSNVKDIPEQSVQDGSIQYTMQADPNGPMAEFITNYLSPYFSNAQLKTIDGKQYIDMTLTGKAYGFAKLQYVDANGKQHDIDVISSTGEKLEQVRVVRVPLVTDANGITKIFVDSGDLGYGAYTLFFKFQIPTGNNPFTDIDGVYSQEDILALYNAGITTGRTPTTFEPNGTMNRAQFAVMLARAFDLKPTKATAFTDVKGRWYEQEVQALVETGIVKGVNATTFNPGAAITRQQAALMIQRMLEYKGYTFTTDASSLNFKDAANISLEAKAAFAELQARGILTGSDGYATPGSPLKRAQMAKILKNSLDLIDYFN